MARAKEPTPGTLNTGRIRGSSKTPRKWTTPRPIKISAMTKKGRREGKTTSHQTFKPSRAALKASSEKIIIKIVIDTARTAARRYFFSCLPYIILPPFYNRYCTTMDFITWTIEPLTNMHKHVILCIKLLFSEVLYWHRYIPLKITC